MKMTIRGPVFETNSSSEHAFMYLSKETFEKWRRGEVRMRGHIYPVRDLTDDDFTFTGEKPDTVYNHRTNKHPNKEEFSEYLDTIDNPEIKIDVLYVLRKYIHGKKCNEMTSEDWDGSYISMLRTCLRHHGECVHRKHANKRYVDPEEWKLTDEEEENRDYDVLYHMPILDVRDNGERVRIHIWGRDSG